MRKALFVIIACLFAVAIAQPSTAGEPVAAELAALFTRTGVDISAVRIEAPSAATMPLIDAHNHLNGNMTAETWPRKTPSVHLVQDDAGRILPEMKQLFEAFPDRFMIGTDTAHTHMLKFYEYRIAMFRVMLAQLAPEAARKIGVENARRVFMKSAGQE